MLLPCCARAGQDLGRPPLEREGSLPAVVWPRSRGGIRGGVARGHGMAVPAAGRCVCGGRAGGGVPPSGVPGVCRAAGVVVGVLASCPGGGPLPEDLRAAAAVRALPGWLAVGVWRFACSVSGGRLIAANATSPYLMVGKRRFMPPVPP